MSTPTDVASFEQLLEHLRQTRGFDFTAYKRTSLMRRVVKRMHAGRGRRRSTPTSITFELHPDEFAALFNTILINVTSFFRDPESGTTLRRDVLPQLLEDARGFEPLRVWSAGCASGEEAYSIAMLLAERIGIEQRPRSGEDLRDGCGRGGAERRRGARHSRRRDLEDLPPVSLKNTSRSTGDRAVFNRTFAAR